MPITRTSRRAFIFVHDIDIPRGNNWAVFSCYLLHETSHPVAHQTRLLLLIGNLANCIVNGGVVSSWQRYLWHRRLWNVHLSFDSECLRKAIPGVHHNINCFKYDRLFTDHSALRPYLSGGMQVRQSIWHQEGSNTCSKDFFVSWE